MCMVSFNPFTLKEWCEEYNECIEAWKKRLNICIFYDIHLGCSQETNKAIIRNPLYSISTVPDFVSVDPVNTERHLDQLSKEMKNPDSFLLQTTGFKDSFAVVKDYGRYGKLLHQKFVSGFTCTPGEPELSADKFLLVTGMMTLEYKEYPVKSLVGTNLIVSAPTDIPELKDLKDNMKAIASAIWQTYTQEL